MATRDNPPAIKRHPLAVTKITPAPRQPIAPTVAPTQAAPVTGKGIQAKTAATFNQNPTLKPNPPDNGSTGPPPVSGAGQPPRKGPAPPPAHT